MNAIQQIQEAQHLVSDINSILRAHGIEQTVDLSDLTITDKTVSDSFKAESLLSNAVVGSVWPSVSEMEACHYTSRAAGEAILRNRTFRLTSLEKRFADAEIRTFCEDHNLNGYLAPDPSGDPTYKKLIMANTFYASFTERYLMPDEELNLWDSFAPGDGVRIAFKIKATNPNFRKIHYPIAPHKPLSLLDALTSRVRQFGNRYFIMSGISRLCCFYLKGSYRHEMEYRMLHRIWESDDARSIKTDQTNGFAFLEIPLGPVGAYGYELEVIQVTSTTRPNVPFSCPFIARPTP